MTIDLQYSLFQKDILLTLQDLEFFKKCITANFLALARQWGCEAFISERRLDDSHSCWTADVVRTLDNGIAQPTTQLDHFKHASFIAFWLRRMIPINETMNAAQAVGATPPLDILQKRRQQFYRYGNEICALLIGYQICLNYECGKIYKDETQVQENVERLFDTRLEYIQSTRFPSSLIADFVMILKHKNMSPYSLYLMYKALFAQPGPNTAPAS